MNFEEWKRSLASADFLDRVDAVENLPEIADEQLIPILLKVLQDPEPLVRLCTAESLRHFGGCQLVREALANLIQTELDPLTKAYAISSLGELGFVDDLPFLVQLLNSETEPQIRIHACVGIFSGVQLLVKEELFACLEHPDMIIKGAAVNALVELVEKWQLDEIFTVLQDSLQDGQNPGTRSMITSALAKIANQANQVSNRKD
ncbi:MAG: hypothetical protein BWK78_09280 [Thiotrichaceae bacterium IS1]|nr:MAG: hypothetical protein BWK78_09280 [Thiotrichaceae bacterium IS1]